MRLPFDLLASSMHQVSISDKNVAHEILSNIIEEKYIISKHSNTSFVDLGTITPLERKELIKLIEKDLKQRQDLINQSKQ